MVALTSEGETHFFFFLEKVVPDFDWFKKENQFEVIAPLSSLNVYFFKAMDAVDIFKYVALSDVLLCIRQCEMYLDWGLWCKKWYKTGTNFYQLADFFFLSVFHWFLNTIK